MFELKGSRKNYSFNNNHIKRQDQSNFDPTFAAIRYRKPIAKSSKSHPKVIEKSSVKIDFQFSTTPILDPRALLTLQGGSGLKSKKKIKKMMINFFSRSFLKGRKSSFFNSRWPWSEACSSLHFVLASFTTLGTIYRLDWQ